MILLDTSIWIDHLRVGQSTVAELLEAGAVLAHPWVTGEIALGRLSARAEILALLGNLPQATVATSNEVSTLVESRQLYGLGIGYVDAQLLAATLLTRDAQLWTRDKRLARVATDLGCAAIPQGRR
ncbi:MAG: type II toxin-antitoxin system VapC family toxin [Actinomycetota bacterium]|nr:type II toxin-antitoxin system VapC family toxin [Actinomycetota bacterium]